MLRDQSLYVRREPERDEPNRLPVEGLGASTLEGEPKIERVVVDAQPRVTVVVKELVLPFDDGLAHPIHDDLGSATLAREIVRKLRHPFSPAPKEELAGHVPVQVFFGREISQLLSHMLAEELFAGHGAVL